jgi:release factor glutamine methyltransferase
MRHRGTVEMNCLGLALTIPPEVFAPAAPFLLAAAVAHEVRPSDRVLDVGTGSGINALVAARVSTDVVAVDCNVLAVQCAQLNANRNGVSERVTALESDLFGSVNGAFDLIVFDPPFRWYKPRDPVETAIADENYESLTRFMRAVRGYLTDAGRVLIHFGTSGDLPYLDELITSEGFSREIVARHDLAEEPVVSYFVFRLAA